MKFNSKQFLKAVETISRLNGGTSPEASYVQFGDGKLKRTTHDAHCEVALEGADEQILLDCDFLKRVKPPAEALEITSDGQNMIVLTSGDMVMHRNRITGESLKLKIPNESATKIVLPESVIRFTLAVACKEEFRPSLVGMILDGRGENLMICGTNGKQLHACDAGETKTERASIIATGHARLIPEGSMLSLYENLVVVESDDLKLIFALVAETPPGFRALLQEQWDEFAKLDRDALLGAVESIRALHPSEFITMEFKSDSLRLSVESPNGRTARTIPCQSSVEKTVKIEDSNLVSSLPFCLPELIFSTFLAAPAGLITRNQNRTIAISGARIQ